MDAIADIVVADGENAAEVIEALGLRKQHPHQSSGNPHADSRERIGKRPGSRYRYDPLRHTGGKHFDGIDTPSPDDDVPQFTPEEEQQGPDDSPSRAIVAHPALRTRDNIQIHRAHQRFMYDTNAAEADPDSEDPNHLEYWMQRPDKPLHALILPSAIGPLAYGKIERGLERLKAAQPGIVIIQVSKYPITTSQPLVDVQLVNPTAEQISEGVRDAIKVPRLSRQTAQDRFNRSVEIYGEQEATRDFFRRNPIDGKGDGPKGRG